MALAAEGLSNKEIAHNLNMAVGTTKIHLCHIFRKVGVKNRTALATVAFRHTSVERVSERGLSTAIKLVPARKQRPRNSLITSMVTRAVRDVG